MADQQDQPSDDRCTSKRDDRAMIGRPTATGVCREKVALSSGCKSHPATAPAGSNRSSYGGNDVAEAFGEAKTSRIGDKISKLKQQMRDLKAMEQRLRESPDGQVSLTDPDARSMATSGRGTGMVGYNVQTAIDDTHHLIVAHEVTNVGNDRGQLTKHG